MLENYWIRALPIADGLFFPNGSYTGGINSGILRYVGAPAKEPTSVSTAGKEELVEANMIPLITPAAPGTPDVNAVDVYKLNFDFTLNVNDLEFYLNGVERGLPDVPVLLQIMSGASAQSLVPSNQLFPLPKNKVVQISFPGSSPAPTTRHPIHLHGHPFSVIRSAGQSGYNFINPPRRDVVSMGNPGDNVTIRFVTDNAGEPVSPPYAIVV
jgi:iron transport multicopper oxidase